MCKLYLVLVTLCLFGSSVGETILDGQCDEDFPLQADFDIEQFAGVWYEISRTPNQHQSGECVSYQFVYNNGALEVSVNTVDANFAQTINGTLEPVSTGSARFNLNLSSATEAIFYAIVDVLHPLCALTAICRNVSPTQKGVIFWKLGRDSAYENDNIHIYLDTIIMREFGVNASETMIDVDQSEQACYELPVIEEGNPVILPGQCDSNIAVVNNFNLDQYKARNFATVNLVTKVSQWRKTGMRGRRRMGRGALKLRIALFAGNTERQGFVRCIVQVRASRRDQAGPGTSSPVRLQNRL
ncbi:Apolipoprotein D [Eumeta japonica]|uniref:Apolipoprotein D n=1 Tax=Eumeta variegata TaxID=151549 RepID=A0A4C1TWA3_EUMVA|nr:Apolipoprotein D [Eumeta japonica]